MPDAAPTADPVGDPVGAAAARLALGYCWPASVPAGDTVAVHASAPGGVVDVEVVRDGERPTTVWRAAGVPVEALPVPADAPEQGCGWPVAFTVPTGADWRPGLHLVRFRRPGGDDDGDPPTAWFVVRNPQPAPGRIVLGLATNTWNAYNDAGGRNLYAGAVEMSFARPLTLGMLAKPADPHERLVAGAGPYTHYTLGHGLSLWHGMAGWAGQERRFVAWAEREGVELDYATDADLEAPGILDGASLLLSVGHDEYWSAPMRDTVEAFADGGGNVAFLSGNTCYWQVRLEGEGGRRMVAWKHRFAEDPTYGTERQHLTTTMWSDPLLARPEAALTGVTFTRGGYARIATSVPHGSGGYEVQRPAHWLLEGTGLARGDVLGGEDVAVGYECDGCELALVDGVAVAAGTHGTPPGFAVVATAPATPFDRETTPLPVAPGGEYELEFHARRLLGDDGPEACDRLRHGHAVLGAYTRPGGGTVVTTGCTEWAYGLANPAVAAVTRTILTRLGATGPT